MLAEKRDELSEWPQQMTRQLILNPNPLFSRHRLAIMLELYSSGAVEYLQLRHDLEMKDGALMTHIKALLDAGWIRESKEPIRDRGRRRRTIYTITKKGFYGIINFFKELRTIDQRVIRKSAVDVEEG